MSRGGMLASLGALLVLVGCDPESWTDKGNTEWEFTYYELQGDLHVKGQMRSKVNASFKQVVLTFEYYRDGVKIENPPWAKEHMFKDIMAFEWVRVGARLGPYADFDGVEVRATEKEVW